MRKRPLSELIFDSAQAHHVVSGHRGNPAEQIARSWQEVPAHLPIVTLLQEGLQGTRPLLEGGISRTRQVADSSMADNPPLAATSLHRRAGMTPKVMTAVSHGPRFGGIRAGSDGIHGETAGMQVLRRRAASGDLRRRMGTVDRVCARGGPDSDIEPPPWTVACVATLIFNATMPLLWAMLEALATARSFVEFGRRLAWNRTDRSNSPFSVLALRTDSR